MAEQKRKPRVLLLYTGMIPSVEISALRPLRCLEKDGWIELRAMATDRMTREPLLWCDAVVCCRCALVHELPIARDLHLLQIPMVYDLDDNFLQLADSNLPNTQYLRWFGSRETVRAMARCAWRCKVGSRELERDMSQYTDHCVIQPYAIDFSLIEKKKLPRTNPGRVEIVYAGSVVHIVDLKMVKDALANVLARYGERVHFTCYGASIAGLENMTFIPYQDDYEQFIRDFSRQSYDIGIAPLMDNRANRSKTNNKYREYAACRVAGIYSDMPVYHECIHSRENGMLAGNSAAEWESALVELIEDAELRKRIADNAYENVCRENTMEAAAQRWWTTLLQPMLEQSEAVPQEEREKALRLGRREGKRWLREQLWDGEPSAVVRVGKLARYNARRTYIAAKEALKSALRCLGLLEACKRLKQRLLYH